MAKVLYLYTKVARDKASNTRTCRHVGLQKLTKVLYLCTKVARGKASDTRKVDKLDP